MPPHYGSPKQYRRMQGGQFLQAVLGGPLQHHGTTSHENDTGGCKAAQHETTLFPLPPGVGSENHMHVVFYVFQRSVYFYYQYSCSAIAPAVVEVV